MRAIPFAPFLALPMLWSCSSPGGGSVPNELATMCIGTISAGVATPVAVSFAEFVATLETRGFVGGWSGSSTAGVLTMRKDDAFAGKSTELAFETEQRPYAGSMLRCQPAMAVLVRAKIDGELLSAYASEDAALTIAQQALNGRPPEAIVPPEPSTAEHAAPPSVAPPNETPAYDESDLDADEQEDMGNNEVSVAEQSAPYYSGNAM